MEQENRAELVFDVMRTRRAVRSFTDKPVAVSHLRRIIEAARWASSAGNRRPHRFFVSRNKELIDLVSAIAPGFYGLPPAIIVICYDLSVTRAAGMKDHQTEVKIDVGTAAMNMQLMAHALGLGTTPVTSFSRQGVVQAIDLPEHLFPELILQVGHPAQGGTRRPGTGSRLTPEDITDWETVGGQIPPSEI